MGSNDRLGDTRQSVMKQERNGKTKGQGRGREGGRGKANTLP